MSTLVPTEVTAPTSMSASSASAPTLTGSSSSTVSTSCHNNVTSGVVNVIKTERQDVEEMEVVAGSNLAEADNGEIHQQNQHQLTTVRDDQAGGQAKMTLGQMALAGIVISSGPGDHFETYEGMPIFCIFLENIFS